MTDRALSIMKVELGLRSAAGQPVLARLEFANTGRDPYELLSWLTYPTGRIDANHFKVTLEGQPAAYIGITKKRRAPAADDYLVVLPGQTVVSEVSLSDAYRIDGPGRLVVAYEAFNPGIGADAPLDKLVSNTVSLQIR